jgi:hypothetical protein
MGKILIKNALWFSIQGAFGFWKVIQQKCTIRSNAITDVFWSVVVEWADNS